MSLHVPQEGSKEWDDQRLVERVMEVGGGEELLEEEMLVSSSNHLLMVMWMSFGNRSSSGYHGGLWWLIEDEKDGEVVICIWREFIGRKWFENGMSLNYFRIFQNLFKHSG
ncbi:hypothetical protein Tco_1444722, partial [Tanacetum coccineum]